MKFRPQLQILVIYLGEFESCLLNCIIFILSKIIILIKKMKILTKKLMNMAVQF